MNTEKKHYRQILGIRFFNGRAREVVDMGLRGGLVVVPSAPVLLAIAEDPFTREALLKSDMAITDSSLMVMLWGAVRRQCLRRVSGLKYLKMMLNSPELREPHSTFWVMPSASAMRKNLKWLKKNGHPATQQDCYIAPFYDTTHVADSELLKILNEKKPAHIIMAIGGGVQEKLGYYLKSNLDYHPGIHCTGAAIGFLSGDQANIPAWADRYFLGWFFRCLDAPGRFVPRYWKALKLIPLILKYRGECPTTDAECNHQLHPLHR